MKMKSLLGLVLSFLTLTIVGCGGGSSDPNAPTTLTVVSSAPTAQINTPLTITANVKKADGTTAVVDGTVVTFTTTLGTLSAVTTTTGGIATATLNSATAGAATVTATAGAATGTVDVTFLDPNAPATVTLTASPAQGVTNNNVPVTLSATVTRVAGGNVPDGTVVTFTSSLGTISAVTTTTNGIATARLNSATAGTASVTAKAGTITSAAVSVPFIAQPTLAIVKIATTGTLPAGTTIGGVNVIASASPSTGLSIAPADIAASGAGAGSTLVPNTTSVAAINLALINTSGIQVGEFVTLTYHVAAGTFPKTADFTAALTGAGVINTLGANIPGIGVTVLSVTVQ